MALTWGEYRTSIRRSVLADPDSTTWSDGQIQDLISWALDRFCIHTAYLKTLTINDGDTKSDGQTQYDFSTDAVFELPADVFESLEIGGRVSVLTTEGTQIYFDAVEYTPGLTPYSPTEPSFWIWPNDTLNLSHSPGTGSQVIIDYFAYYPVPGVDETDAIILIPRWAQKPVATLVGAFALESQAIQSATIDRWKSDFDSGNPEHNALRRQMEFLLKHYEYEVSKHPPQDRANFFRTYQDRFK